MERMAEPYMLNYYYYDVLVKLITQCTITKKEYLLKVIEERVDTLQHSLNPDFVKRVRRSIKGAREQNVKICTFFS